MTTIDHHNPKTTPEVGGIGHSVRRTEDARFLEGRGNYVDDEDETPTAARATPSHLFLGARLSWPWTF